MNTALSFLISAGLAAFGVWIIVHAIGSESSFVWTLLGILPVVVGSISLTPVGYESEAELEPARKTMEGVEAQCFIANSVKARVTLTPEFVVAPPPQ
jgi:hypothetical protein